MNDPVGLLAGNQAVDQALEADTIGSGSSLYPDGFTAERFIDVLSTGAV